MVYGSWWWADYPPIYWHYPSSYVFVSGFYWGPRVYIGPRFYFSGCHWHERRVYVVDRHHHHGHRFYNSRSVVRHVNATRWRHNPAHRRGVAYYDNRTRERFNSPRESYRESQAYRANLRGDNRVNDRSQWREDERANRNPNLAPNQARDLRQNRSEEFQQRLERRQAGQISTPTNRAATETGRVQPRAEQLRERMNNRNERTPGAIRNEGLSSPPNPRGNVENRERNRQPNGAENRGNIRQLDRTGTEGRLPQQRIERAETPRYERTQIQRQESQIPARQHQRIERAERTQPAEQPRFEQPRIEQRAERMERFRDNSARETRGSNERSEIRGGRER